MLVVYSVFFWDRMQVDDPVGAISVHGVGGAWGMLCVGLFASGDYGAGTNGVGSDVTGIMPLESAHGVAWFSPAGWQQLGAQGLALCVLAAAGFIVAFAFFRLANLLAPMRVRREVEVQGLDVPETGAPGYPDFELKSVASVSDVAAMHRGQTRH